MARVFLAPEPLPAVMEGPSIFLAGSIEMGRAEAWQDHLTEALSDTAAILLNPRRLAWDSTWAQSIDNPPFREQVEWELEAQERASWIAMYFSPQTKSPITLLELGLFARSGKLLVCCPEGFWRRGNVEVVCARYGVPTVPSREALIDALRARLGAA